MYILVPWKPVVLVWGLLSGIILVSFVASSLLQGKDPSQPRCDKEPQQGVTAATPRGATS